MYIFRLPWWLSQLKNPPAMQETRVQSPGREEPLEEGMATHSSILAWRVPWTEEPGGLQSMELQSQTRLSDFHFTSNRVSFHEQFRKSSEKVLLKR